MQNTYYILRHGETIYQIEKRGIIYPWPENSLIGLTKRGKERIKTVAEKLKSKKIDFIYSSDATRTFQSAIIIAKELEIDVKLDARLRDMDLGIYKGGPQKEFYQAFPDPRERFTKRPEKGESWNDCKKRILGFINEVNERHQQKTILIVSHGDPLWLLEGEIKGLSEESLLKEKMEGLSIKTGELRKLSV